MAPTAAATAIPMTILAVPGCISTSATIRRRPGPIFPAWSTTGASRTGRRWSWSIRAFRRPRARRTAGMRSDRTSIWPSTCGPAYLANDLHDKRYCENWVEVGNAGAIPRRAGLHAGLGGGVTDIAAEDIRRLAEKLRRRTVASSSAAAASINTNSAQTNRVFMFLAAIAGNWGCGVTPI